jgi:putative ABC transport system permease protein
LGIRLREGRELTDTDIADSPLVLVINESMARRYFGGEDPVGKRALLPRIVFGNRRGPEAAWEVVGVVADEKVKSLRDFSPGVYASYRQSPSLGVSLVVRASGDPGRLAGGIRAAVQQLNSSQPLGDLRMLEEIKSESLGSNRLRTGLLALFAFLALLLATIGIYGVLSYSVSRRTHEMGIRAALGATRGNQLRLILGNGLSLTGIGIGIGVLGSLAVSGVLSNLMFGVSARDPGTLLLVGVVLAGVAAAACYLPARRATKVDPVVALRHE